MLQKINVTPNRRMNVKYIYKSFASCYDIFDDSIHFYTSINTPSFIFPSLSTCKIIIFFLIIFNFLSPSEFLFCIYPFFNLKNSIFFSKNFLQILQIYAIIPSFNEKIIILTNPRKFF